MSEDRTTDDDDHFTEAKANIFVSDEGLPEIIITLDDNKHTKALGKIIANQVEAALENGSYFKLEILPGGDWRIGLEG